MTERVTDVNSSVPLGEPAALAVSAPTALRRSIVVNNPQGLHLRPAAAFAKRARDFAANVTVCRDDRAVNGKSQLDLVLLAAESGTELTIEAAGIDAESAIAVLGDLLGSTWTDDVD